MIVSIKTHHTGEIMFGAVSQFAIHRAFSNGSLSKSYFFGYWQDSGLYKWHIMSGHGSEWRLYEIR